MTGENRRTKRKTCPSATLSTTNPKWIDPGANPVLRGERPLTNDLSHGTAFLLELQAALFKTQPINNHILRYVIKSEAGPPPSITLPASSMTLEVTLVARPLNLPFPQKL
jgi:hypothetical protein